MIVVGGNSGAHCPSSVCDGLTVKNQCRINLFCGPSTRELLYSPPPHSNLESGVGGVQCRWVVVASCALGEVVRVSRGYRQADKQKILLL